MTPEQLAAIRAYVEAATPGPWEFSESIDKRRHSVFARVGTDIDVIAHYGPDDARYRRHRENHEFIARIRTDAVALLDEVERLTNPSDGRCMDIAAMRERNAQLSAEVERLRAALEYYAHPEHYEERGSLNVPSGVRPPGVLVEKGDLARKALEGK